MNDVKDDKNICDDDIRNLRMTMRKKLIEISQGTLNL